MNKITQFSLFLALILILLPVFFVFGCNNHAYVDCVGNNIYWYDSCGNREDLFQDCARYNLTCKYGQCVQKQIVPNYVAHHKTACYNNSVYWYDSLGAVNSLHTNCQDQNSCTQDECKDGKCINTLKCDGTTCQLGSGDFNTYCATNCGNGICENNLGENEQNCSTDCKTIQDNQNNNLSISFFVKKDLMSSQWDKFAQIGQNQDIYFMITLNNNSQFQINENIVAVNIPGEISFLGNLKVDDVAMSGDIVSGVNIGSIQAMQKKTITFEGKTQSFETKEEKQALAFINSVEPNQSDVISINFDATQNNYIAEQSQESIFGWFDFLKRWFMWIIAATVLIFLFIIIFKRISSNV
jgi:hypothetical protein